MYTVQRTGTKINKTVALCDPVFIFSSNPPPFCYETEKTFKCSPILRGTNCVI